MKQNSQFFICFFLPLLILGMTSCSKNPPQLKREKTEKLQQICDALQKKQPARALALVKTSPELRNSPMALHLRNRERDRKLIRQLNDALLRQHYSGALAIIQEAEQQGLASAELLRLKELPYALQALQLFCVRMPWENAEDLQKNWKLLARHETILRQAPAFRTFRQEQNNLLNSFRREDFRERTALILAQIDGLCAGGRLHEARKLARNMNRRFPDHIFCRMNGWGDRRTRQFSQLLSGTEILSADQAPAFELTAALAWPDLSSSEQQKAGQIISGLPARTTISGMLLDGIHRNTDTALLNALLKWQKAAGAEQHLPPHFQNALLRKFRNDQSFPGISAVLFFLHRSRNL